MIREYCGPEKILRAMGDRLSIYKTVLEFHQQKTQAIEQKSLHVVPHIVAFLRGFSGGSSPCVYKRGQ